MRQTTIITHDGSCPAYEFRPSSGEGPWPGVLFIMDGLGIRPTLFDMGQRLANAGYYVLLPDLYYRAGPYDPVDANRVFHDEAYRNEALGKYFASTDNEKAAVDAGYFIAHLDEVAPGRIGVHGYCMGGGMALTIAATHPDRIAAVASFHGGDLATDAPLSPHLKVGEIEAKVYIAGAVDDSHFPPEQAEKLEAALQAADVDYRLEIYEGARHGWTMADTPVYNPEADERHWRELLALYKETLHRV